MIEATYSPPLTAGGKITLTLPEEDAKWLAALCLYGARWDISPLGSMAHEVYYALLNAVPSFDDNVDIAKEGQAFREAMGKWFERNRFFRKE